MSNSDKPLAVDGYGAPDRWFVLALLSLNYFTLYLHCSLLGYIQPSLVGVREEHPLRQRRVSI